MEHRYRLVDVFTRDPLSGNQLAVFLDGAAVPAGRRQALACELRLSETTYVLASEGERARRMQIFTPAIEVPFAGHPTLGTAHVLALEAGAQPGDEQEWNLLQVAGPVRVSVRVLEPTVSAAAFTLERPPEPGPAPPSRAAVAEVLGLTPDRLGADVAFTGFGTPFLLVELADVAAVSAAGLNAHAWREHLAEAHSPHVYLYTRVDDTTFRARLFAPAAGIAEDPATGSACAALAARLAHLQGDGTLAATIHQGVEMGRPSRLSFEAEVRGGLGGHPKAASCGHLKSGQCEA